MIHRSDIDGLRGIAILLVILYHAGLGVPGGYVGVDIFFVLSGFLISSILFDELEERRFRFGAFLLRRLRRLYPALIVMCAVSIIPAYYLFMPRAFEDAGEALATAVSFTSNFLFFTEDGYFDGPSRLKPLLHTWSLGVEEQFYLVFPLILISASRVKVAPLRLVIFVVFILSIGWSVWQSYHSPSANFYLLPSRMWELLLGSMLASFRHLPILHTGSKLKFEVFGFGGLMLIVASAMLYGDLVRYPGYAAILPCLGCFFVLISGFQQSMVSRLLSLKALVFLGWISYSLYLWHWPLLVYAEIALMRPLAISEALATLSVAVLFAILSWRYVERPFRGSQGALSNRNFLLCCAVGCFAVLSFGLYIDQKDGLPQRIPAKLMSQLNSDLAISEERQCVGIAPENVSLSSLCPLGEADKAPTFILWGDSHAASIAPELRKLAKHHGIAGISATSYGCPPLLDVERVVFDPKRPCKAFNDAVFSVIREKKDTALTVVLLARWAAHAEAGSYKYEGGSVVYLRDSIAAATTLVENHEVFRRSFLRTIAELRRLNVKVIVLGSIPEIGLNVPQAYFIQQKLGRPDIKIPYSEFLQRQATVDSAFQRAANQYAFDFIDLSEQLCSKEQCYTRSEEKILYSDSNHLSRFGIDQLRLDQLLIHKLVPAE